MNELKESKWPKCGTGTWQIENESESINQMNYIRSISGQWLLITRKNEGNLGENTENAFQFCIIIASSTQALKHQCQRDTAVV